jgi:malate dehydrogenase
MGQAAFRFGLSLIRGLQGEANVIECAYVDGGSEHAEFFAQPVVLGKNGIEKVLPYGELSAFETNARDAMLDTLKADIKLGVDFVK